MKKNLKPLSYLLLLFIFSLGSCNPDDEYTPTPPDTDNFLVSADFIATVPQPALKALALNAGYGIYAPFIQHEVSFYKIVYKIKYEGEEIEASGLLAIPQGMDRAPALLSAQHGTQFLDAETPSGFPNSFSPFVIFAAAGYATVIPDYIGYGVSDDILHPYFDQKYSARAVVNMIKAAKEYLKQEQVAINNNLFLVGYSEGGYVTMAAQKEIETDPSHDLALTAVAAGAGAYDLSLMLELIAEAKTYSNPALLAFIVQAYNTTYNWHRPLTDFFQEPYAAKIPGLLDGSKSVDAINSELPDSTAKLFNTNFFASLQDPGKETDLRQALENNSFLNWVPESPTRLYHGTADETISYQISEATYNRFKAAGATNVTLLPIPGGTHQTSIEPMMGDVVPWFASFDD